MKPSINPHSKKLLSEHRSRGTSYADKRHQVRNDKQTIAEEVKAKQEAEINECSFAPKVTNYTPHKSAYSRQSPLKYNIFSYH